MKIDTTAYEQFKQKKPSGFGVWIFELSNDTPYVVEGEYKKVARHLERLARAFNYKDISLNKLSYNK